MQALDQISMQALNQKSSDKLVPLVALLVALLSVILAQFQKQQVRFWGVLGVGVLTLLIGLYRPLIWGICALWRKRINANVVRRNMSEFRRLSGEAALFLEPDPNRTDTLQSVLYELIQRHSNIALLSKIPNAAIFHDHWFYLNARICEKRLSTAGFHNASRELFSLVNSYNYFSVIPVFAVFASEFREILTADEKSKMNAFQQQYVGFLGSYITFHKRLNEEFHGLPTLQTYFRKPAPL